jgi:hypothetical protein
MADCSKNSRQYRASSGLSALGASLGSLGAGDGCSGLLMTSSLFAVGLSPAEWPSHVSENHNMKSGLSGKGCPLRQEKTDFAFCDRESLWEAAFVPPPPWRFWLGSWDAP